MILEKNSFKKILIVMLSFALVLFLTVAPVHASPFDKSQIFLSATAEGTKSTRFYNTKMYSYEGGIFYQVLFDAEFTIDIDENQRAVEDNFLETHALFIVQNIFYTGFKFDFKFHDNNADEELVHTGRVNMISNDGSNGDLYGFNKLGGFSDNLQFYTITVTGQSQLASNPEDVVMRDVILYEGYDPFPFANSDAVRSGRTYGDDSNPYKYILGEDGEYLNFKPTELKLRFEEVMFRTDLVEQLEANGYYNTSIEHEQTLINLGYDEEITAEKGFHHPDYGGHPHEDFAMLLSLQFKHLVGDGSTPGAPGTGTGAGDIFMIIPNIMVAIFSFFWMIGEVELGGIPGLTLVGITTFFVGFMVIKFIIGLFKGGGD